MDSLSEDEKSKKLARNNSIDKGCGIGCVVFVVALLVLIVFGIAKLVSFMSDIHHESMYASNAELSGKEVKLYVNTGVYACYSEDIGDGTFFKDDSHLVLTREDGETLSFTKKDLIGTNEWLNDDPVNTEYEKAMQIQMFGTEVEAENHYDNMKKIADDYDENGELKESVKRERELEEEKKEKNDQLSGVDIEASLRAASEDLVKRFLSNPAEASFPWFDWTYDKVGNIYAVMSSVDSKNPYGTKVAYPFYIEYDSSAGNLSPIFVQIGDDSTGVVTLWGESQVL